jgi:hypothetical protein
MQRWVERSEARWALWAGVAGAVATGALGTKLILAHGSPVAGLGFVFLPLVAAAAAVPVAIWGAAVGHVVAHLRGRAAEPKIVLGSLWDVMGENRRGEPVLALAARHPNATESVKRRAPR